MLCRSFHFSLFMNYPCLSDLFACALCLGFHRNEDMKAIDVLPILKEKVAFLSGQTHQITTSYNDRTVLLTRIMLHNLFCTPEVTALCKRATSNPTPLHPRPVGPTSNVLSLPWQPGGGMRRMSTDSPEWDEGKKVSEKEKSKHIPRCILIFHSLQ